MPLFASGKPNSPRSSGKRPELGETLQEAAQDLEKLGKLQIGREGIVIRQLKQIAEDEIRDVRQLKARALGGGQTSGGGQAVDDLGDFIICDDYRRNEPPPPNPLAGKILAAALMLAGLAAGGVGGPLLVHYLTSSSIVHETTITKKLEPQEFEVRWWVKDGVLQKEIRPVPSDK